MLASLVSAPRADLVRQATMLADLVERGELLGIHLEGPFINGVRCGAQDPAAIIPGDPDLLEAVCDAARGTVRAMTLAPVSENFEELDRQRVGEGKGGVVREDNGGSSVT